MVRPLRCGSGRGCWAGSGGGREWSGGGGTRSPAAARRSRDEGVTGLVDGGGDVGPVDRPGGGDGDRAGGQVHIDRLDAGDAGDLLGDRALAVVAGHAGDGEGG